MNILFIHQAFPAQFGGLGLELKRRHGWNVAYIYEEMTTCPAPTPEILNEIQHKCLDLTPDQREHAPMPWPQIQGRFLELCVAVRRALDDLDDFRPDLIVAHGGRGAPSILVEEVFKAPLLIYCEYYFAKAHKDISYRIDLPKTEPAEFFPRCINGPTTLSLVHSAGGYSATHWQKSTFPKRFQPKIEVHFDGVDAELYKPNPNAPRTFGDITIPPGVRVVTFVSRGLESIRGFDIFLKVARNISLRRQDVVFVVVGAEHVFYGWDQLRSGAISFRDYCLQHIQVDLSRFIFMNHLPPEILADVFAISDLHLYLTAPFVLSWSLLNAMSTEATILASDVDPVREVIEPGIDGLLEPLFDVDRLTERALEVLDDPAAFRPLGIAARRKILEKYSLDVAVPDLRDYFERMANQSRS